MWLSHRIFSVFVFSFGPLLTLQLDNKAQLEGTCPAIVQQAVAMVDEVCTGVEVNEACYGNTRVTVTASEQAVASTFDNVGDRMDLSLIRTIQVSPMDVEEETWGIALLRAQANLPNTLPGQAVTMIVFGDVVMESQVEPEPLALPAQAVSGLNLRGGPSTTYEVVGGLQGGEIFSADGRSADGAWLRVIVGGKRVWASANLVSVSGDAQTLAMVEVDDLPPVVPPMQAFTFRAGIGDSRCDEAPDSGILIQTPKNQGRLQFTVNGVDIVLSSTAYFWMPETKRMNIAIIEGQAEITSAGVTVIEKGGQEVWVVLDENGLASSIPSEPETLPVGFADPLPLNLLPEVPVFVTDAVFEGGSPPPLDESQSTCLVSTNAPVNARPGPGTEYFSSSKFSPDDQRTAIQKATTPEGTWYNLGDFWVRDDVVNESGDCDSLPELVPVDYPETPGGGFLYINYGCRVEGSGQSYIRAGQYVTLAFLVDEGMDVPKSELGNQVRGLTPIFTIDGVSYVSEEYWVAEGGTKSPINTARAAPWRVPPGTHTVSATWGSYSASCSFTAYNG